MSTALAPRTEAGVTRLATAWGGDSYTDRLWYEESLSVWLARVAHSPHTARSYARTVVGFFQWAESRGLSSPARIKESDVDAWVTWMLAGGRAIPVGLPKEELAALDAVLAGHHTAAEVANVLSRGAGILGGLFGTSETEARALLGNLVKRHTLVASPPLHEQPPLADVRYRLPAVRQESLSPATVAQRLSALGSLFRVLVGQHGRRAGLSTVSPVVASPVTEVLSRWTKRAVGVRVTRSDARKTRKSDWDMLREACWTRSVPARRKQRDWTVLVCLATTGLRVSELCQVTLGGPHGLTREPDGSVHVTIVRKGGGEERLLVPVVALGEIETLHNGWRDRNPALPAACLAVRRWGNQASLPETRPISASQVQAIVRGLARSAAARHGIPVHVAEARMHPHGLRHLYAQTLAEAHVPIHEIRTLLGHKSLATTDAYLTRETGKDVDHSRLLAGLVGAVPAAVPTTEPSPAPPPAAPEVLPPVADPAPPA